MLPAKQQESHSWRQEASQRFRSLLQNALQAQRISELSDDSMTQAVLEELREERAKGEG